MLKPFKIISEKSILDIQKKYSVNEVELETPEGKTTTWKYIQGQKDIVVVLPLDAEHNVYLKQEWRLNRKDFAWEVVSGWIEEQNPTDEQIIATAQRELQEEVGVKAGKLEKLITIYPFNHTSIKLHLFLATELLESKLAGDEHEILEVTKLPFNEAFDLVVNKQIPTGQNTTIFLLTKQKLGL